MLRLYLPPFCMLALALTLGVGRTATAAPVRGTVVFLDEAHGGTARHLGFWRVPNGVLPIAPPAHDVRAEAVVVLYPQGTVTGAQVAAAEEVGKAPARVEVHLAGLRISPAVVVVPPGATVLLRNDDRVPHTLACPALPDALGGAIPPAGQATLPVPRAGEYLIHSEEYGHMSGAVLAVEGAYYGRVDADGNFRFEAPEGHYQAKLFWRGTWQAGQPVDVQPHEGAEVHFQGPFGPQPPPPAPAPRRAGGE